MKLNPKWGHGCEDSGQMDGRSRLTVEGCNIYGRLSRWPLSPTGRITGPEEVLLDTEANSMACVQFATHSIPACVVKGADGYFYISFGDGAAFTTVDPGDLGHNPCQDNVGYEGAFRSQDPTRWNGKTLRLDPVTFAPEIMTTGHRNPYRLTTAFGAVYATETGEEECGGVWGVWWEG
jgi:glucose/arabinose dehydrogenase